jgi:hypothetical protein
MWTYDGHKFGAPTFQLGMALAGSIYSTVNDLGRFVMQHMMFLLTEMHHMMYRDRTQRGGPRRLREHSVAVEQIFIPDEIHDFLLWKTVVTRYKATAEFFQAHLGGRE